MARNGTARNGAQWNGRNGAQCNGPARSGEAWPAMERQEWIGKSRLALARKGMAGAVSYER
jgi:hypothetical protein